MALPTAVVLSGLDNHALDQEFDEVFKTGEKLLMKSPSETSIDSTNSQESGISSMSSGRSPLNLAPLFDLLTKELKNDFCDDDESGETTPDKCTAKSGAAVVARNAEKIKIIYRNRNLLDLNSNIQWKDWPCRAAVIKGGVANFFDNRSLYSRLMGPTALPPHKTLRCKDCHYDEPFYF